MIKFSKLPDNIFHLLPKMEEYLKGHPDVIFAYLFGSLAQDRLTPLAEVDLVIYLLKTPFHFGQGSSRIKGLLLIKILS